MVLKDQTDVSPLTSITFDGKNRPVRLVVHHYITHDDTGVARIYLSRLVNLKTHKN